MTVKLYRSLDVGAPELSDSTAGSLITILRACLVDGYGSRTAAGWTMPFSDLPNNKAAFQSVSGDSVQIDDNNDYRWASALGFKTMSALDVGTEQYPDNDQIGAGNEYRIFKRYNTAVTSSNWAMIVSDNWFYFVNNDADTTRNYPAGFFFGQYDCLNPSFTENYILTGYVTTENNVTTSYSYRSLYVEQYWYARRNYQSALKPEKIQLDWWTNTWVNPNPFTGSLELEKVILRSELSPHVRYGCLPNHLRLLGATDLGYRGGELFDIAGVKYIILAYSDSAFAVKYDVDVG